jgi:hypothetical protein
MLPIYEKVMQLQNTSGIHAKHAERSSTIAFGIFEGPFRKDVDFALFQGRATLV